MTDPKEITSQMRHLYSWRVELAWQIGLLEDQVTEGKFTREIADQVRTTQGRMGQAHGAARM